MSLTITSINVNGIRAAVKQRNEDNPGMLAWLAESASDVVLLQEVRATVDESVRALQPALDAGWHYVGAPAAARGRAGVGILSRAPLDDVRVGMGSFVDSGRWIEGTFDGVRVASLYLPSGSAGTEKQDEKYRFLDEFSPLLEERAEEFPDMVIGGDWNICHRREDLKNWKGNMRKSGFLCDERSFMDSVFGVHPDGEPQEKPGLGEYFGVVEYTGRTIRDVATAPKWFDVARRLQPEGEGPYTWWTYRGQAFNNNAGWRIDYQAATRNMLDRAEHSWVDRAPTVETRWSDHSPLNVTYA